RWEPGATRDDRPFPSLAVIRCPVLTGVRARPDSAAAQHGRHERGKRNLRHRGARTHEAVRQDDGAGRRGPDRAGRTTAVRILATLLRPDSGAAYVCGYDTQRDAHQVRQLIGLTGQYASVDEGLSGTNNLIMIGRLLGLDRRSARARAVELLARFELADAAGRRAKTYSGGMRRRLDLAASLVGRPRVLYLDEPTTGLDPHSRNEVWAMVREMVAEGTTVLLTTQYLEEADQLAHDIVVINHGAVIATGTPDELKAQTGQQVLEVTPADRADVP